jgi:hypothetical protein
VYNRPMRIFLGFVAGALAVLTFHQGMVEALYLVGLTPHTAFRATPTLPFGMPLVLSHTFWGGLYGAIFAAFMPRFRAPLWLCGIGMGFIAALATLFVVAPIKGHGVAYGWAMWPVVRTFLVIGTWGLGVGLILPLLRPRPLRVGERLSPAT